MVTPDKDDSEQILVMRTLIHILKDNNAFPEDEKNFNRSTILKFALPALVTGSFLTVGMIGHLYIALKRHLIMEGVISFEFMTQLSIVFLMLIIWHSNWQNVKKHFETLSKYEFGEPKSCQKLREEGDVQAKWVYYSVKGIVFFHVIFHYVNKSYCEGSGLLEDHGYVCGIAVPVWYPVNMHIFLMKEVLCFCVFTLMVKYYPVMFTLSLILSISARQIILRLEELKRIIADGGHSLTEAQLVLYIRHHTEIINCVEKMNNDIGYNYLPHFICLPPLMALFLYQLLIERELIFFFALIPWSFPIFSLCRLGERLEQQGEALSEVVYDIPWYHMEPKLRKSFLLFCGKVQMPLRMKVKPLSGSNMNHLLIYQILKGTYSFLVFVSHGKQ